MLASSHRQIWCVMLAPVGVLATLWQADSVTWLSMSAKNKLQQTSGGVVLVRCCHGASVGCSTPRHAGIGAAAATARLKKVLDDPLPCAHPTIATNSGCGSGLEGGGGGARQKVHSGGFVKVHKVNRPNHVNVLSPQGCCPGARITGRHWHWHRALLGLPPNWCTAVRWRLAAGACIPLGNSLSHQLA